MKKPGRIVLWIAGLLVVLLVVAVIALKLFFPKEKVRRMAEERAEEFIGRDVTIANLDLSFWGGLGVLLEDVTIANHPEADDSLFVSCREVDAKLGLLPLLSGEYRVKRLILDRPTIALQRFADGTTNFALDTKAIDSAAQPEVKDVPDEVKVAATVVSFDMLEIRDAALSYQDDSSGMSADLTGLGFTASLTLPREQVYASEGKLEASEINITTDEPMPAFSLAVNYDVLLDWQRQELTIRECDLKINDLKVEVGGSATDVFGEPKAQLHVSTSEVEVGDVFSLLSPSQREVLEGYELHGDFSLDVDLGYDGSLDSSRLDYSGSGTIAGLTMSAPDIPGTLEIKRALADFRRDNVRIAIEDGFFDGKPLKGNLILQDFDDPTISGELAGDFDLVFMEPFLPEGKHDVAGRTTFETTFSGRISDPDRMEFSGSISVQNGRYASDILPEQIDSFQLELYFDRALVDIRRFEGVSESGEMAFKGRINNLLPYLLADSGAAAGIPVSMEGSLDGQVRLEILNRFLPDKGNPELTGVASVDLRLSAASDDLANIKPYGTVSVEGATYTDSLLPEPIRQMDAVLRLSPDTIQVSKLDVRFESSDVQFSGRLIHPFPYLLPVDGLDRSTLRRPLFLFSLSSVRLDVDKLFPEAVPGAKDEVTVQPSVDSVSFVFVPDIDGEGSLQVDSLVYNEMEFSDVKGRIRIRDRKITCDNLTAGLYAGTVTGKTTIDLNDFENPQYVGSFAAEEIEVNGVVARFTEFGGYLFGKSSMSAEYNAHGWDREAFRKSLNVDGSWKMDDGMLKTSGAVYKSMSAVASAFGEGLSQEQAIKKLASKIVVEDGKIFLSDLTSRVGSIGDLAMGGWYGFDGDYKYVGAVELSKETTKKLLGSIGDLPFLSEGVIERLSIPIEYSSTGGKSSYSLNLDEAVEEATKSLGKDALKNLGSSLKDLFKK